jgi:hypothetical protein
MINHSRGRYPRRPRWHTDKTTVSDREAHTLPEVSIVIPTRDRRDWLPRTVLSALRQRDVDAEVIVVDDGSREAVASWLSPQVAQKVRLLRHERSKGMAAARNAGIAAAHGVWVAFLDDDDLWAPLKLRRQLDVAAATGADLVYAGGYLIDHRGQVLADVTPPPADRNLYRSLLAAQVIPLPNSNLIARASLLRAIGGYDMNLAIIADWDLNVRLSANGRAAMLPDRLVAATLHGRNAQLDEKAARDEFRYIEQKHAHERATLGVDIDRVGWLQWRLDAHRLSGRRVMASATHARLAWLLRDPLHLARSVMLMLGGERSMRLARRFVRDQLVAPEWLRDSVNRDSGLRSGGSER